MEIAGRTVQSCGNGVTKFTYNPLGELLTSTDPEGNSTYYTYDLLGHLLHRVHPDAGTTSYTYDESGNLTSLQTQNLLGQSQAIDYTYNYNQLYSIIYPENPENNVTYRYGSPSDGNQAGRIKWMKDASGVQTFNYGNMGEITRNVHTFVVPNGHSYTFDMYWEYDSWNRTKRITYPDAEIVNYYYNKSGQLKKVNGVKDGFNYKYIDSICYNKFGARNYIKYGNGTYATYKYNQQNQTLTNLKSYTYAGNLMQNINYTYDNAKNITAITNSATSPNSGLGGVYSYTYNYDNIYRLTSSDGTFTSSGGITYPFDLDMAYSASGNITSKVIDASTLFDGSTDSYSHSYVYDYESRPHVLKTAGDNSYEFDNNGNMTLRMMEGGTRYLCWDEENRLTSVRDQNKEQSDIVSSYLYNASGDRTWKLTGVCEEMSINGAETVKTLMLNKTLYSSSYLVVNDQEYTKHYYIEGERICTKIGGGFGTAIEPPPLDNDTVSGNTIPIPEQLWTLVLRGITCTGSDAEKISITPYFSAIDTGATNEGRENYQYFYHPDHLGSSSFITNRAGSAVEHLQYLPFGESFISQRSTSFDAPYKFSGKEKDDETSYSYFGARYYDSDLSIWLSVDPLVEKRPDLSPYNYCSNNPIGRIDPTGALDGWYEGEDGVTRYNKNVHSQKDMKDNGISGTYKGEQVFGHLPDGRGFAGYADGSYALSLKSVEITAKGGAYDGSAAANAFVDGFEKTMYETAKFLAFGEAINIGAKIIAPLVRLSYSTIFADAAASKLLPNSGPIIKSLGAASKAEMLAAKLKLNINSPVTRQVLNSLDQSVESFITTYRKASIKSVFPGEYLNKTVEEALRSGNTTVRKLLIDGRFVK